MLLAIGFALSIAPSLSVWDSKQPDALESVAFGSCNKQTRLQPLWPRISEHRPSLFLWTGDAVYASSDLSNSSRPHFFADRQPTEATLARAYARQLSNDNYTRFLRGEQVGGAAVAVEGVYVTTLLQHRCALPSLTPTDTPVLCDPQPPNMLFQV